MEAHVPVILDKTKKEITDPVVVQLRGPSSYITSVAPGGRFIRNRKYIFDADDFNKWRDKGYFTKPVKVSKDRFENLGISLPKSEQNTIMGTGDDE
jgi:hypothetical protein